MFHSCFQLFIPFENTLEKGIHVRETHLRGPLRFCNDFAFVAMLFPADLNLQMDCQAWDKGMNYSDQACRDGEVQGPKGAYKPPKDPNRSKSP